MCYQAGLTPSEFWNLSWLELNAVLEGYYNKQRKDSENTISLREISVLLRVHTANFINANRKKGKPAFKDKDIMYFHWEERPAETKEDERNKRNEGIEKAKAFREKWEGKKTRKISM